MDRLEADQGAGLENSEIAPLGPHVRAMADRRQLTWRTALYGFLRSRRRETRRAAEPEAVFTDWHHPWLFLMATGIMLMSSMDAFFTLQLLERGAIEINPVMDFVIGESASTFAAVKLGMTGFGILALVFLARLRFMDKVRTGLVLTAFFSAYAVLICYEFVNLINRL